MLDSRHCDAFRTALRSLLVASPEVLLLERNRSGAASRCADAIRADGFVVDDRLHEESLEHVVVDDTSDPAWLSTEASGALVIRVRRGEKGIKLLGCVCVWDWIGMACIQGNLG